MISSPVFMAIDYGTRYVGIAISDGDHKIALPYATLVIGARATPHTAVVKLLREKQLTVEKFVIGSPVASDGSATTMSAQVDQFAQELSRTTKIPFMLWNEFSTSKLAATHKSVKSDHSEAARIILQEYLDFQIRGY